MTTKIPSESKKTESPWRGSPTRRPSTRQSMAASWSRKGCSTSWNSGLRRLGSSRGQRLHRHQPIPRRLSRRPVQGLHHPGRRALRQRHPHRRGRVQEPDRVRAHGGGRGPAPALDAVRAEVGKDVLSSQNRLIAGLLRPAHLIDVIRHFTLFKESAGKTVKIVGRYQ